MLVESWWPFERVPPDPVLERTGRRARAQAPASRRRFPRGAEAPRSNERPSAPSRRAAGPRRAVRPESGLALLEPPGRRFAPSNPRSHRSALSNPRSHRSALSISRSHPSVAPSGARPRPAMMATPAPRLGPAAPSVVPSRLHPALRGSARSHRRSAVPGRTVESPMADASHRPGDGGVALGMWPEAPPGAIPPRDPGLTERARGHWSHSRPAYAPSAQRAGRSRAVAGLHRWAVRESVRTAASRPRRHAPPAKAAGLPVWTDGRRFAGDGPSARPDRLPGGPVRSPARRRRRKPARRRRRPKARPAPAGIRPRTLRAGTSPRPSTTYRACLLPSGGRALAASARPPESDRSADAVRPQSWRTADAAGRERGDRDAASPSSAPVRRGPAPATPAPPPCPRPRTAGRST
jgi:hypothetical protein